MGVCREGIGGERWVGICMMFLIGEGMLKKCKREVYGRRGGVYGVRWG